MLQIITYNYIERNQKKVTVSRSRLREFGVLVPDFKL